MPDEDNSQSAAPSSEPAPEAPVEPTVPYESVAPPEAPIQVESVPEAPTVGDSVPVPAPISDPSPSTTTEPVQTIDQPESITIPLASSNAPQTQVASQAAPQASVQQVAPQSPSAWNPHSAEEINYLKTVLGPKAWAAHRIHRDANLEKVMELARKKGTIDRTDVRLHLQVAQATATRYLTELVHEGKLVRKHVQNDNIYTMK
jgi:hypothetical protein